MMMIDEESKVLSEFTPDSASSPGRRVPNAALVIAGYRQTETKANHRDSSKEIAQTTAAAAAAVTTNDPNRPSSFFFLLFLFNRFGSQITLYDETIYTTRHRHVRTRTGPRQESDSGCGDGNNTIVPWSKLAPVHVFEKRQQDNSRLFNLLLQQQQQQNTTEHAFGAPPQLIALILEKTLRTLPFPW